MPMKHRKRVRLRHERIGGWVNGLGKQTGKPKLWTNRMKSELRSKKKIQMVVTPKSGISMSTIALITACGPQSLSKCLENSQVIAIRVGVLAESANLVKWWLAAMGISSKFGITPKVKLDIHKKGKLLPLAMKRL